MKKILFVSLLILTGCTTVTTPVVTNIPIYIPQLPPRVKLSPVTWEVINNETNTYFALDAANYENLSKDIADTTAYIEKLRVLIYSIQHTNYTLTNTVSKSRFSFRKLF
jgi:hypothetical protein